MIVTQGGLEGGYGIYLKDGKPVFTYNFLVTERMTVAADEALPAGKTKLVVDFKYDGPGDAKGMAALGKGGTITVTANGKNIAQGRLERTVPVQLSLGEGLDVGMDVGSPVDFNYQPRFAFTGKIEQVTVELK